MDFTKLTENFIAQTICLLAEYHQIKEITDEHVAFVKYFLTDSTVYNLFDSHSLRDRVLVYNSSLHVGRIPTLHNIAILKYESLPLMTKIKVRLQPPTIGHYGIIHPIVNENCSSIIRFIVILAKKLQTMLNSKFSLEPKTINLAFKLLGDGDICCDCIYTAENFLSRHLAGENVRLPLEGVDSYTSILKSDEPIIIQVYISGMLTALITNLMEQISQDDIEGNWNKLVETNNEIANLFSHLN